MLYSHNSVSALLGVLVSGFFATTSSAAYVPSVTVKNGTYNGVYLPSFDQDIFLGIPYSLPPVAPYRFLPARSLNTSWAGTRNASAYGNTCPSATASDLSLPYGMSEDCLSLNVVRPSGSAGMNLPILFWIHGGSYQSGAASLTNYNLSYIVDRSVEMGKPIIAVSINYRKGPWGLMYGEEIKKEGVENLAIKDALLALRWVKENLGAFGGDVGAVTIQGESAGSFMVGQLIVAGAGRMERLFHKAIQESGSASTGTYNGTEWYEPKFQLLLNNTNCTSLACLRAIPYERLYPAMNQSISGSWYPVLDPVLFPEHPAKLLATGQYNKIPIIDGVNTDEGTDNAYFGINTDQQMIEHLTTVGHPVMTPDNVGVLMNIYSPINLTDPSPYGIPFKTTVDPVTAASLGLGTQYKRYAAIVGDLYYHGPLLHDAELYAKHSTPEAPVYIYRFDTLPWNFTTGSTQTFQQIPNVSTKALTASYKGRAHFSETPFVFRNPAFYGPDLEYKKLADQMSAMWVNFVNTGNPTPVITQNASQYMCFSSAANTNVSATVAGGLWEPYFLPATVPAADRDDGSVVGKVLVIRTDSRGSSILESNNWRLAGRSFIVKKMQQVYGE